MKTFADWLGWLHSDAIVNGVIGLDDSGKIPTDVVIIGEVVHLRHANGYITSINQQSETCATVSPNVVTWDQLKTLARSHAQSTMQNRSVRMSDQDYNRLKQAGGGNASAGLRRILDQMPPL